MNNQSTPLQQKPSALTYALALLALVVLTIAILVSSYHDRNTPNNDHNPTPYTTVTETTTATNPTPVTANPLSHHARPTEPNND